MQSLSSKSYKTVLALPDYLYFDFLYSLDQRERGYYWGSHGTDAFKAFSLAPDNLPQNAEIMGDRDGQPFSVTSAGAAAAYRRDSGAGVDGSDAQRPAVRVHGVSALAGIG